MKLVFVWFREYKMNQYVLTKENNADGLLGLTMMFIPEGWATWSTSSIIQSNELTRGTTELVQHLRL